MTGRVFVATLVLTLGFGWAPPAHAGRYTVELVTMTSGGELFTGFGHTALRIRDHETGADLAYDYGTYNAHDPLLAPKFFKGELPYWLAVGPFASVYDFYATNFGGVVVQTLALPDDKAAALADLLVRTSAPELREYAYHHFHDNCTTRVRDLLDDALGGALAAATRGAPADGATFRTLIDGSLARFPLARWPVFGLLNGKIDVPLDRWARMFLPAYLMAELDQLTLSDGAPAVTHREVLVGSAPALPLPVPSLVPFVLLLALLAALCGGPLVLGRRRPAAARVWSASVLPLLALITGFYGTLMVIAWLIAPYPETHANGHLLVAHPGHLALVVLGPLAASRRAWAARALFVYLVASAGLCLVALGLRVAGLMVQQVEGFAVAGLIVTGLGAASVRLPRDA